MREATQPVYCFVNGGDRSRGRKGGACDHHNGQTQIARGGKFWRGGVGAGVFRDEDIDTVLSHQACFGLAREGGALEQDRVIRRQAGRIRGDNAADEVVMLWRGAKRREILASGGEEHTARRGAKSGRCGVDVRHNDPVIVRRGLPAGPLQTQERCAGLGAGSDSIATHLRGKRVCGVDHRANFLCVKIGGQTFDATKTTLSRFDVRQIWGGRDACQGKDAVQVGHIFQRASQCEGFGGAAENQHAQGMR